MKYFLVLIFFAVSACAHVGVNSVEYQATILFFEGGAGNLKTGPDWLINRCSYRLAKEGLRVEYMPLLFSNRMNRLTEQHFQSIQEKVDKLKKAGHRRIWLMGISNGTYSVMNAGCNRIRDVQGIIIINLCGGEIQNHLNFRNIRLPILIVTHEKDMSYMKNWTPEHLKYTFPNSSKADIIVFSGGVVGEGPQATHLSQRWQHGLRGLEKEFVKTVSDFIGTNQNNNTL